jgi:hypothetical protein
MNPLDTTSLKPGDEVAVKTDRYGRITYTISRVKSVSPTGQVTLDNGERSRPNGIGMGERPFGEIADLVPVTEEIRMKVCRQGLVERLRKHLDRWYDLPTPVLERLAAALGDQETSESFTIGGSA